MDKIYMTQAYFDDWESSWSIIIGVFTKESEAYRHKEKWESFFKENQSIFKEPAKWEQSEEDYMYEVEEWEESSEFSTLCMKYSELRHFNDIKVEEVIINKDIFKEDVPIRTEPMKDLIKQWDRDFKLKDIL